MIKAFDDFDLGLRSRQEQVRNTSSISKGVVVGYLPEYIIEYSKGGALCRVSARVHTRVSEYIPDYFKGALCS